MSEQGNLYVCMYANGLILKPVPNLKYFTSAADVGRHHIKLFIKYNNNDTNIGLRMLTTHTVFNAKTINLK